MYVNDFPQKWKKNEEKDKYILFNTHTLGCLSIVRIFVVSVLMITSSS